MICKKCNSEMEVKSQFRIKRENQDAEKLPTSYLCPKCKNSVYKEYES